MPKTIELAVGAAIFSHILLALLWAGWAREWLVAALALAAAAVAATRLTPWRWGKACRWLALAPQLPFLGLGLLYLCYALAPPTAPDAIGYHLGLVSDWLRTGTLARPVTGFYDAMPHGLETLFFAAASVGGLAAASLVHFAFLLGTLPLIAAIASRLGFDGRPAALLYFATPVVAAVGVAAYVDAALAFYTLATLYLLLDERNAAAGLTAGFCYAIKMSGGVVTLAACLYLLLARRSWTGVAAAAAMVAPWLAAAWWLTGNPVAPMLSAVFVSPAFPVPRVEDWMAYVRSYGVPWGERLWEVTMGGTRAQGLLGPAYLLAPAACGAALIFSPAARGKLAKRGFRLLLLATSISAAPWLMNAGTRFLIPAAAFAGLAVVLLLPAKAAWGLALAQVLLCLPPVLDRYVPAGAWRLNPEVPWRAALRLETETRYLRRVKPEALVSMMVGRHVRPGGRVLDIGESPRAYAGGAVLHSAWQYVPASRALSSLVLAHLPGPHPKLGTLAASWPRRRLSRLRFELASDFTAADPWIVQEVRLLRQGAVVFPSRAWELAASSNPWELPLVFDRNLATGWSTLSPGRAGMFMETAGSIDCDGVELVFRRDTALAVVRVVGFDERGGRLDLAARMREDPRPKPPPLDLRTMAVRHASREGYGWILADRNQMDQSALGRALIGEAADWGLEVVEELQGTALLRIAAGPR